MSENRVPNFLKKLSYWVPDRLYIQLRYFSKFHKFCNLRSPRTFNEKLQWLKLNYRREGDWKLVDKHEVKSIVAEVIGEEYIIPTIAVYSSVDEIDLSELPDSFVIKCTHDSGGVILVKDKNDIDVAEIRDKLSWTMRRSYFFSGREPHYKGIVPRIIVEPYLEDNGHGQLLDYKFFCFDGQVKSLFVAADRAIGSLKFDYFDEDFLPLDMRQPYPNSEVLPRKPECFQEMLSLAQILSQRHPHVRVDFYQINGKVYFGELTFFHFGGFEPFRPREWDRIWGDWLTLPAIVREY